MSIIFYTEESGVGDLAFSQLGHTIIMCNIKEAPDNCARDSSNG